jgi:hypothetical protein
MPFDHHYFQLISSKNQLMICGTHGVKSIKEGEREYNQASSRWFGGLNTTFVWQSKHD